MFTFVSGSPSADLTATLAYRHRDEPHELLGVPGDFARWAVAAGLVESPVVLSEGDLAQVKALRESIYRLLAARAHDEDTLSPGAIEVVNLAAARPPLTLSWRSDRLWHDGTVSQLLSSLARDALQVLGTRSPDRIKECAGDDCSRVFVDVSRNATRRWCGMRECGDKAKASAYRTRRKASRTLSTPSSR